MPGTRLDYHALSDKYLAGHPELVVPKGTTEDRHGHVKIAVLYCLAETAAGLAQADGQAPLTAQAKTEAAAVAALAWQLAQTG